MKYVEKARGKAVTLGQLRALVAKLDGVPDNAVVRTRNLKAKEISVDEDELLPAGSAKGDDWGNPGLLEPADPR